MNDKSEFALEGNGDWAYPKVWDDYWKARSWCEERNWIPTKESDYYKDEETPE